MDKSPEIHKGIYEHFKGGRYEAMDTVFDSETQEEMVLYRALYGQGKLWVRPRKMFEEVIEREGEKFPRFRYVDDARAEPVFFYEHEFYVFSNFSSFAIEWKRTHWMTSEHAYHSEKFVDPKLKEAIRATRSAHDALNLSHEHRDAYRKDWDNVKLSVMKEILHAKAAQHPYVMKKLLDSGNRPLIEDSWRDDFWGWGPNKDGQNHLGKLWMVVRDEVRRSKK